MLAPNVVSHLRGTIEASEPEERERSGNWKMFTVSFIQLGSSMKNWSPRKRTATVCVTPGALHLIARELSMYAVLKAGRAFSFVSGSKVCQIRGRSSGLLTLASLQREGACKSQRSAGFFFLACVSWDGCVLENVGRGQCGWLCARAWHQLSLQCLAADCDVIRHLEGREGFYSWASSVYGRPEPCHEWRQWGVLVPGCASCQNQGLSVSW